MELANGILGLLEKFAKTLRLPATQLTGQVPGTALPPAGSGVPYAASAHTHPLDELEQSGAADGDVPIWDDGLQEWVPGPQTGGAGVTDGDKGDIVVSSGGTVWSFDSSVVSTFARTFLDDLNAAAVLSTIGAAAASHTHAASDIASGQLALARGGTGADLSATGGTSQYLKQAGAGAAVTVGTIAAADLPAHTHQSSGQGGTLDAAAITAGTIATARLGSGTANSSSFLRGDQTWQTISGSGVGLVSTGLAGAVIPGLQGILDIAGTGGAGFAYEFNSGDTAPTWSAAPNTSDVGTTHPSYLYVKTTASAEHFGTWSWAPSGAFDLIAGKLMVGAEAASASSLGLHVQNSDNTVRLLCQISGQNVNCQTYASGSYTSRASVQASSASSSYTVPAGAWVRITRDGSNNVTFYFSQNGVLWNFMASLSFSITVAKVGFRVSSASGTAYFVCDWLRANV